MSNINAKHIYAHSGMGIWAVIVGFSFPVVGFISESLPPLLLTALRFLIALLAILPLAWKKEGGLPSLKGVLLYSAMGACLAAFFAIMFWVSHMTTALSMATLYVSVPLLAYLLGRVFAVEPRASSLLVILVIGAVGALGLALAETGGKLSDLQFRTGEAFFFFGCASSALYPVLSKYGLKKKYLSQNAAVRTLWSLIFGSIIIGVLGVIFESPHLLLTMTLSDFLLISYLGIFSSGVTFWLQQNATALLTPGVVTAYSYLVPSVSMILLFWQQPDSIGARWLPGSLLVLLSITLLMIRDTNINNEKQTS